MLQVAGNIMSKDLVEGAEVTTLQGTWASRIRNLGWVGSAGYQCHDSVGAKTLIRTR